MWSTCTEVLVAAMSRGEIATSELTQRPFCSSQQLIAQQVLGGGTRLPHVSGILLAQFFLGLVAPFDAALDLPTLVDALPTSRASST